MSINYLRKILNDIINYHKNCKIFDQTLQNNTHFIHSIKGGAWENGEIETVQDATKICEASIKLLTTLYNLTHDGKILQMSDQLKDINQIIQQL